jgi:ABC-type transport system involved in cytochrome c biogenesis permease component
LTLLWGGQYALAQLLILSLAFTASGSFREEQESGALELLLVTPLNEQQIIGGRVRGIWNQFLPAALVLSLSWLFLFRDLKLFGGYRYDHEDTWRVLVFPLFFVTSYLTLPFVGLYFSLRRMNFIAAWLLTCLMGLFVPFLIYGVLFQTAGISQSVLGTLGAQLAGAMAAWFLLNRQLGSRVFGVLRSDSRT